MMSSIIVMFHRRHKPVHYIAHPSYMPRCDFFCVFCLLHYLIFFSNTLWSGSCQNHPSHASPPPTRASIGSVLRNLYWGFGFLWAFLCWKEVPVLCVQVWDRVYMCVFVCCASVSVHERPHMCVCVCVCRSEVLAISHAGRFLLSAHFHLGLVNSRPF